MSEAIVVALITGGMSLLGVVLTCLITARKSEKAAAVAQAVTETKLEELAREVRMHNNFAQRMPVVESEIRNIYGTLKELKAYHRSSDSLRI